MNAPRILIADDEPALRAFLEDRLAEVWPEATVVASVGSGTETLAGLRELEPDIAFLDIRMPGCSGLDVAGATEGTTRIVFVTAFDEYAIDAFDNAAVDYLLKPVDAPRLAKTVDRLKASLSAAPDAAAIRHVLARLGEEKPAFLKWVKVGQSGETRIVPVDEIAYFKAEHKYTTVRTPQAELLIRRSIKELETELDPERFWRVHRSTLVNVRYVDVARRDFRGRFMLNLKGIDDVLRVSDSYAWRFRQM